MENALIGELGSCMHEKISYLCRWIQGLKNICPTFLLYDYR